MRTPTPCMHTLSMLPAAPQVLEEGLRRLQDKGTWKLWSWRSLPEAEAQQQSQPALPQPLAEFYDSEAFRAYVAEYLVGGEFVRLLPRDDPKAPERPAEAAFRQRM
jgi:hypothetical protein